MTHASANRVLKKHKLRIKGPAGAIETVIEEPAGEPRGLALVAHPHPLRGGSLDNKVAWTLARAALNCGLVEIGRASCRERVS
jgi:alpha/beta superfamily hydrolase